jgi:predicted nucleic acid-binding protein
VIVVDASAILDLLLWTPAAPAIEDRLFATGESLHAPHLLDLEVAQVLRRYSLAGELAATRGQQALEDLAALPITRYPHDLFLLRIWALRHNLTAYDAAYVALAESLGATLLTRDERLRAAPGVKAVVELV